MVNCVRFVRRYFLPKVMALLLVTVLCPAQENPSTRSSRDQEEQNSRLMFGPIKMDEATIRAAVIDKHQQPAGELVVKDFTIYEDGRRQTIIAFFAKGSEYFFAYKPTNPLSNGGTRIVKIKVHKRGMRVQAPKSYSADISKPAREP